MTVALRPRLSQFMSNHGAKTKWHRLLACGHQFTGWKPVSLVVFKRILLLFMVGFLLIKQLAKSDGSP